MLHLLRRIIDHLVAVQFSQFSHSVVSDSATPWATAHQASLSITNFQSLLQLMSIESVMPSNGELTIFHLFQWKVSYLFQQSQGMGLTFLPIQFSSVAQSYPTLCNQMNHSMPGLPVHHQFPEFTQTQVHLEGLESAWFIDIAFFRPNRDCFIGKEVCEWVYKHGIHCSYYKPQHSEAMSLIKHWNSLLMV